MITYKELLMVERYITFRVQNALKEPKLYPMVDIDSVTIERKSMREYDLTIQGKTKDGVGFSSWLVLGMMGVLPWTNKHFAKNFDYPEMCVQGDWSGVRDTSEDKLWKVFEVNFLSMDRWLKNLNDEQAGPDFCWFLVKKHVLEMSLKELECEIADAERQADLNDQQMYRLTMCKAKMNLTQSPEQHET